MNNLRRGPPAASKQSRRSGAAKKPSPTPRILSAIIAAVPIRQIKRDLLFIAELLLASLANRRLEMIARSRSIKGARTQQDRAEALKSEAQIYKIEADALALTVKQELSVKDRVEQAKRAEPKRSKW